MISPQPSFDPADPGFQVQRDAFQESYFPELQGLEEHDQRMFEAYQEARARMLIRAVAGLTLAAAGGHQKAADRLGVHRSVLSNARNHGIVGSRPLANMFGDPMVLARMLNRSPRLCRLMARAGFIAAAEYAVAAIVRIGSPHRSLSELDYELLCATVAGRRDGNPAQPVDEPTAAAIVARVLAAPDLDLTPDWFTLEQCRQTKRLMKNLRDSDFALQHIRGLQADWIQGFVYVWATLEGEGDEDLWYAG